MMMIGLAKAWKGGRKREERRKREEMRLMDPADGAQKEDFLANGFNTIFWSFSSG